MVATLIVTQGRLAESLLDSTRRIAGEAPRMEALRLEWEISMEEAVRQIREAVGRLDADSGVLVLTDMPGGTPFNAARRLESEGAVAVLSGVNLPMVVRLACCQPDGMSLSQLVEWIREKGRKSICDAEDVGCRREGE